MISIKYVVLSIVLGIILSIVLGLLSSSAHAYSSQWPLRGKGEVRYLKMIKVYDAYLFSPQAVTADNVLKPSVSKCLQLNYAVNLSVDKFRLATRKILMRQHSSGYLKKIKAPLEILQESYKPVKKGDYYRLCYDGRTQKMSLDLNKNKLVEIQSAELARAYLGIWLSKNKPISVPLYKRFFPVLAKN